jgi:transposase-like protein
MVKTKSIVTLSDVKEILGQNQDFLKEIVSEVLQQTLEHEMDLALGAGKSVRTESRLGYRSGDYNRTLITRIGKLELRDGRGSRRKRVARRKRVKP